MNIRLKTPEEIAKMRDGGRILYHGGFWLTFVNILAMFAWCFWKSFQEQREKHQAHTAD